MRKILLLTALLTLMSTNHILAYLIMDTASVGKQPVFVFYDEETGFNIFCAGYDQNFDGVIDEGDENSSWWRVKNPDNYYQSFSIQLIEKVRDFGFNHFSFYFKPGIDLENRILYTCELGIVRAYNIDSGEMDDDFSLEINAAAISAYGDHLYFSIAPWDGNGHIIVYNRNTNEFVDTIPAGMFPSYTMVINDKLIVLNEGSVGMDDASVQVFEIIDNKHFHFKTINVGSAANHIVKEFNSLIVTVTGSHKVVFINTNNFEIYKEHEFPSTGWDGPRATINNNNLNYTVSYDGYLYRYNSSQGETNKMVAKGEMIVFPEESIRFGIILHPLELGSYNPSSLITAIGFYTSVDEKFDNSLKLYPNPANDKIYIEIENSTYVEKAIIMNSLGKIVAEYKLGFEVEGNLEFSTNSLVNGSYFLLLQSGESKNVTPFIISR